MALEFLDDRAERRFIDMFDINKIRDTLDDENATQRQKFSALKREKIWEESQAEIWEQRRRKND